MRFAKQAAVRISNPLADYDSNLERIVYILIFLFPIAGMSVNHWITGIFNILVLIGLFTLKGTNRSLTGEEKIFLWICVAYFSMFIVSSVVNGWTDVQTRYMGTELRFLLVIPLYLLVRRYKDCSLWLLRGCVVAGFFLFGQSLYDVFVLNRGTAWGVYSKNIIGPFAVLVAFFTVYYFWNYRNKHGWAVLLIILLSAIASLVAAGMSGSRGGYVGFIITALGCVMFFSRPRWMFASSAMVLLVLFIFYHNSEIVKNGVDNAVGETQNYVLAEDHVKSDTSTTSVGARLEMIRTGFMLMKDNPIFGIGPGNYTETARIYVRQGKAHPEIGGMGYPHNAFLEVATAKGLIGLITLLLLLYYPFYIFIRDYKVCKSSSVLGLIHIIALSVFSLTDHSVVVMNNYTSILLLGLVLFFASHIRSCHRARFG